MHPCYFPQKTTHNLLTVQIFFWLKKNITYVIFKIGSNLPTFISQIPCITVFYLPPSSRCYETFFRSWEERREKKTVFQFFLSTNDRSCNLDRDFVFYNLKERRIVMKYNSRHHKKPFLIITLKCSESASGMTYGQSVYMYYSIAILQHVPIKRNTV